MKRVGLTWRADPDNWEFYRDIHINPWPDLIPEFQKVGIHNFSVWAFGTRLFGYLEIPDDEDVYDLLGKVGETDIKIKWDEEVTVHVLSEAEEGTNIQFLELEEIFYVP